jgi:hypothetical protein
MAVITFSRYSFKIFLSIMSVVTCLAAANGSPSELQKIDALLKSVKSSNVTFIRNGTDYTAEEAHEHLRRKLKSAQNSWFAPPKEEWTAKLFIEKIGSHSSLSKKPYLVRFKDGKVLEARVWLTETLRKLESGADSSPKPPQ